MFPPGEYTIETEEESIPGSSIIYFRHVETVLITHPAKDKPGPTHFWAVDPEALNTAIAKDADQALEAKRLAAAAETGNKNKSESE